MYDSAIRADGRLQETGAGPPGLLATGHFHARWPYRVLRSRGTQDWLLTYTLAGQGRYRQRGADFRARAGDLVLLEPGAAHDYGCLERGVWDFVWAHFLPRPHWLDALRWPAEGKGLYRLRVADAGSRKRLRAAFLRCDGDARQARSARGAWQAELALNGLEETLFLAAREHELAHGARRLSPPIRRVVEHLAGALAKDHAVAELARLARLSPSRFAHRFKQETGDAAIAFLLKLRLREAARMLAVTGRSVKEAAAEVGFHSPFYFSRCFSRHFGVSPREYQRRGGGGGRGQGEGPGPAKASPAP
ncbi:MAG: helix-turn-helix domain-containing protein [Planctomycetota bacterium]|nr:helix-turn-helix domain-containing protein [Planctomycetota bacterium]